MNMIDPIGAHRVRIDGTCGVEPHGAPDERVPGAAKGPQGSASEAASQQAGGLEVIPSQKHLIAAAAASEDVDARAVEEARAVLRSGQLDTPEAAARAAQALVDLGP